jgi:glutamine amidotransferase
MSKNIVILDYQLGNLFSVKQACDYVGLNAKISSETQDIIAADGIILPGVGAFKSAMENLEKLDLIQPLKEFVSLEKPLFGICLGLQLLFTESEEFGSQKGLDFISGTINKFSNSPALRAGAKVPQIGWNRIYGSNKSWIDTPLKDINQSEFMYFVHSYYVEATNEETIVSRSTYEDVEYCSSVKNNSNIFATQFHPEKSGHKGLSIYSNWAIQNNLI